MPPLPSLSKEFNDMVGKPFNEAAFRTQAQKEGYISRVIPHGGKFSKDKRTNRVNAQLDEKKNVANIYLG